jgi:hypothetical protein
MLYAMGEKPQETDIDVKGTKVWGHRQIDTYFIECILQHKQPTVTIEDSIKAEEAALKMVKT